jgi:hypothetical protein
VYYKSEGANHDSGAIDPFISLSLVMYCTPDLLLLLFLLLLFLLLLLLLQALKGIDILWGT